MRVLLNGQGQPIPLEALPIPSADGDLPPQRFILTEDFDKTDWVGLGYTHFEVFCIGACGGRGPGGAGLESYPPPPGDRYVPGAPLVAGEGGWTGGGAGWPYYSTSNPDGSLKTHWHDPFIGEAGCYGGGGGGGGLHRVAGLLSDLDTITEVIVGQAGADGETASLVYWDPFTPRPPVTGVVPSSHDVYDPPIMTFYPIAPKGEDGGYSSFGDDLAMASGGKGGGRAAPPPVDDTIHSYWWKSDIYEAPGAEGGIGGRTAAGGGAAGSSSTSPGLDGGWDGVVGEGGGGGRGGVKIYDEWVSGYRTYAGLTKPSTSGGQGSYSFGDTTMFGNRETRDSSGFGGQGYGGGGGGAKVGTMKYGSRAPGFDPNGAVIIRLTKIA